MASIDPTTRRWLGWSLVGISFFQTVAFLWGSATWSHRLGQALEPEYGELTPYLQNYLPSRGATVEFFLAVLAATAGVGWVMVARRGRVPGFLDDWRGLAALIGGGTVSLAYAVAAAVPLMAILEPREIERIPSWDGLGVGGDAIFLLVFAIDAVVVAWWTIVRWRQPGH